MQPPPARERHRSGQPPKGEKDMADKIAWETEFGQALRKAKSQGKPVLLDFFNPG